MLCAKNLKVVKATLIMILGVGGFTSAQAAMDLTSTELGGLMNHSVAVYAAETIESGSTGAARNFSAVMATGGTFTVDANVGYNLPAATYYIRYDLVAPDGVVAQFADIDEVEATALVFGNDGDPQDLPDTATIAFDVDNDSSTAIWEATIQANAFTDGDVFRLNLNGTDDIGDETAIYPSRVKVSGSTAGGDYKIQLRVRIYDNVPGANSGVGGTYLDARKPIIAVDNTLSLAVAAPSNTLTADVASAFKKFVGEAAFGVLSTVNLTVKTTHDVDGPPGSRNASGGMIAAWDIWDATTGMQVAAGTVMAASGSSAEIAGNFAVGTFTLGREGAKLVDANNKELEKFTEGDNRGKYMEPARAAMAQFGVGPSGVATTWMSPVSGVSYDIIEKDFAVNVGAKNDDPIPVGSYSAKTTAKAIDANAPLIAAISGQDAGKIVRNGTVVHLGYLTTYEGHNQRLVMVNRGPLSVAYELGEIVTEDGTTAMAGHMATGELMPKSSMVIQVRDLVSFGDGGTTRASATLSLAARRADISVATTLVNTMDRSTDTVTYEAVK